MKQLKLGVSIQLLKNKLIFSGLGYKFEEMKMKMKMKMKMEIPMICYVLLI